MRREMLYDQRFVSSTINMDGFLSHLLIVDVNSLILPKKYVTQPKIFLFSYFYVNQLFIADASMQYAETGMPSTVLNVQKYNLLSTSNISKLPMSSDSYWTKYKMTLLKSW